MAYLSSKRSISASSYRSDAQNSAAARVMLDLVIMRRKNAGKTRCVSGASCPPQVCKGELCNSTLPHWSETAWHRRPEATRHAKCTSVMHTCCDHVGRPMIQGLHVLMIQTRESLLCVFNACCTVLVEALGRLRAFAHANAIWRQHDRTCHETLRRGSMLQANNAIRRLCGEMLWSVQPKAVCYRRMCVHSQRCWPVKAVLILSIPSACAMTLYRNEAGHPVRQGSNLSAGSNVLAHERYAAYRVCLPSLSFLPIEQRPFRPPPVFGRHHYFPLLRPLVRVATG